VLGTVEVAESDFGSAELVGLFVLSCLSGRSVHSLRIVRTTALQPGSVPPSRNGRKAKLRSDAISVWRSVQAVG
jgi:hypothetical protein